MHPRFASVVFIVAWIGMLLSAVAVAQEPADDPSCDTHIHLEAAALRESTALASILTLLQTPEARAAVGVPETAWQLLQTCSVVSAHVCGASSDSPYLLIEAVTSNPRVVEQALRGAMDSGAFLSVQVTDSGIVAVVSPPGAAPPSLEALTLPVPPTNPTDPSPQLVIALDPGASERYHPLARGQSSLSVSLTEEMTMMWTHSTSDSETALDVAAQARALVELGASSPMTAAGGVSELIRQARIEVRGTQVTVNLAADATQVQRLMNLVAEVIESELP